MKFKPLYLAVAATASVAALAGCPTTTPSINPTPTPAAAATPTPAPTRTTSQNLIFQSLVFRTDPAGQHSVIIKNATGANITDLANYVIAYYPRGTTPIGGIATSSILDNSGTALTSLANNGSLRVYLFDSGSPVAGTEAETDWDLNTVQYGTGGELAIFKAAATTSANITDYVRWGTATVSIEPVAVSAGLWKAGDNIATVSVPAAGDGAITTTKTQGGIGLTNWTPFATF